MLMWWFASTICEVWFLVVFGVPVLAWLLLGVLGCGSVVLDGSVLLGF